MRGATIVELARRKGSPIVEVAERGLEQGFRFAGLPEFVEFFIGLFGLVTTAEEFERVTHEVLEDAARQGAVYAELRWTPTSHLARGADEDAMFAGIEAGRRSAERTCGVLSRSIVDFPRSLPPAVAEEAVAIAVRQHGRGVVALDVSGDERAVAADPRFAPVFARARAAGLHATAHAGEAAGAASVSGALDLYGARRIGHGTRSGEDPRLVERLGRERIVLEVCPTSNVALGVVSSVAAHPVRELIARGVPCVVSSDDPTLFGTDLVTEYERLHREAAIPRRVLGEMAALSLEVAFLEPGPSGHETRERLRAAAREARRWAADAT
jgi:aminodeoxyfutalosine deaminase